MGFFSSIGKAIKAVAAPVAAIAAPLVGGKLGAALTAGSQFLGGFMTNEANAQSAAHAQQFSAEEAERNRVWQEGQNAKAMDFSAKQAEINRSFQEVMSSTAHRREINDLREAGLNPILSATGGMGASSAAGNSPSGVTSSGGQGSGFRAEVINTMASALQMKQVEAQVQNIEADTEIKKVAKNNAILEGLDIAERPERTRAEARRQFLEGTTSSQKYNESQAETERIRSATLEIAARISLLNAQADLTRADAKSAGIQADLDEQLKAFERVVGGGSSAASALANTIRSFIRPPSRR